jgi:uncharacterized protein (TIGR00297 family)
VNRLFGVVTQVSASDWIIAISGFSIILSFLLFSEALGKKYQISSATTRKFIHITTGLFICGVAYQINSNFPLLIFASLYIFIDLWAIQHHKFKSIHPDKKSLGTMFYAVTVFLLALIFWNEKKPLFIITNMIMIVPDAMAAILGSRYANSFFKPLGEKKSLIGAATMFILTVLLVSTLTMFFYDLSLVPAMSIGFISGAIATAAELLSIRGSDNLSVPMLSGLFLYACLINHPSGNLLIAVLAGAVVGLLSFRLQFLNTGGSLLAFLMGSIIFGLGGWMYALPVLVFFISASILSKLGRKRKKSIEAGYQKTNIRDFYQTLANGGLPAVLTVYIFLSGNHQFYAAYLVSIAVATADTWATELGIYSKKHPLLVTTFRRVVPGTSGAISLQGSFAALSGSALIVIVALPFNAIESGLLISIILTGFCGSFIDSLLGATLQVQYCCKNCGKMTENKDHCQISGDIVKGIVWVDNDLVNIFSICIATVIMIIFIA